MTKFTKGILITGLIIGLGVGGKYGYDYLNDHGYFEDKSKTNIETSEVEVIEEFLNDEYNIGFIQVNYNNLNLNNLGFASIFTLLNNQYKKGRDESISKIDLQDTKSYIEFKTSYIKYLNETKICYDTAKLNAYLLKVTNQTLKSEVSEVCTTNINSYDFMINVSIEKARYENDIYTITYKIYNAENLIYLQKYPDSNITAKVYNGTVELSKIEDRYIFISNNIDNTSVKSIYNLE